MATTTRTMKQRSVAQLNIRIRDSAGEFVTTDMFGDFEYLIVDRKSTVLLRLTLGNGVSKDVDGTGITVNIAPEQNDFSGDFYHQFVPLNTLGQELPWSFQERLRILKTYKQEA